MSISDKLLNVIEDILNRKTDKFEKMDFKASVIGKRKDGKYNVRFGQNTYLVPNASGREYDVGDTVWIHKPNGADTGQFIIASEYGNISSGGGTGGAVSSVDGQVGDVILTDKYASKYSEHTHDNKSILDTITSVLVNKWNTAYSHATSAHARIDATLTEKSDVNGNIKINGIETKVYELPSTVASVTDVSTAKQEAIDTAYQNANGYTDTKIANLINGAPETLDTLKEVADAITESKTVEEALNNAIGTKASQVELDTHTSNGVIHIVASEREKWNNTTDKMGTTDISAVGSTATEAISNLNAKDDEIDNKINVLTTDINTINNNLTGRYLGLKVKTSIIQAFVIPASFLTGEATVSLTSIGLPECTTDDYNICIIFNNHVVNGNLVFLGYKISTNNKELIFQMPLNMDYSGEIWVTGIAVASHK